MRRLILRALGVMLLAGGGAVGLALAGNPNERDVKPEANVQDTDDIDHERKPDSKLWVLHFRFKDPRLITADIPGRGRRLCWYLWYQVINYTNEPRSFIPDFELVTQEKSAVYHDQILPSVQEEIRKREDGDDRQKIKNSVTIAAVPIPPSKKDGPERAVTGVAIWDGGHYLLTDKSLAGLRAADVPDAVLTKIGALRDKAFETEEELLEALGKILDKADVDKYAKQVLKQVWEDKDLSESNRYSIFISGLSNGVALTDPVEPNGKPVVRRKTLRLDFKKVGDQYYQDAREIHFLSSTWTYRAANLKAVSDVKPAPKDGLNPPMK
jgi:hypothetical protein